MKNIEQYKLEVGERFDSNVFEVKNSRDIVHEFGYSTYDGNGSVWTVVDWYNIKSFINTIIDETIKMERERIFQMLDWRNCTERAPFNDGDDVVEWIDKQLQTLTQNNE